MICYSKQAAFHPDWAWSTPEGFRDEPFVLNFSFPDLTADGLTRYEGLPVQCDDDAEFLVRSVLIPQLGVFPAGFLGYSGPKTPGLLRISTSGGQQLSRGLLLGDGMWCNSGWGGTPAAGPSLVDPLKIPAGGVISVDLLLATNAEPATASFDFGSGSVLVYSNVFGVSGDGFRLMMVDPGISNASLEIVGGVPGSTVEVQFATDGAGTITSTWDDVAAFVNVALADFFIVVVSGDGATVGVEHTFLTANGSDSSAVTVSGAFVGVKRFRQC